MSTNVCIPKPSREVVQETTENLAQDIAKSANVSGSIARSIAGAFVGNVIDNKLDPYDENGLPLFTLIGALAGTRTAVRATNSFGSAVKSGIDASMPRKLRDLMQMDDYHRTQDWLDAYGYSANANDVENVRGFKGMLTETQRGLAQGKGVMESILGSRWIRSQFAQLHHTAKHAPVAKKIINYFRDIPNQIKSMKGSLQAEYNAKNGTNAYENFIKTKAPAFRETFDKLIRDTGGNPERISDRIFQAEVQEAIHRILDTGLGGPNATTRAGVLDVYGSFSWKKSFDQALINDDGVKEFINTTRNFFTQVTDQSAKLTDELVTGKIDELKVLLKDLHKSSEYARNYQKYLPTLVDDYRASGMSWKQFVNSLDNNEYGNLAVVLRSFAEESSENNRVVQLFHQIRQLQTKVNHQRSMDRSYVPHVQDKRKMTAIKQRLMKANRVRDEGDLVLKEQGVPTFEEFVQRRTFEVNYGQDRKLYIGDTDLLDFQPATFGSKGKAKAKLQNIIMRKRALGEITPKQYSDIERRLDDFITQAQRETKGERKPVYFLETPSDLGFNPFLADNKSAFDIFSANYRAKSFDIKKSSRLDYERKLDMPYEFRQTDHNQLLNSYINDVAPRLHSMRNGIYDAADFNTKWITPLKTQLGQSEAAGSALEAAEKLKGIYNTMHRVSDFQTPQDMRNFERMARVSNLWRNVMAGAYQYGIAFYNTFEHAVQSPLLATWNAYFKTMRLFTTNRKAANAMSEMMVDWKVTDMQMKSQNGNLDYIDDIGGLTLVEKGLERSAEFASNFSLTKYLGKMVPGFDIEKTGVLRIAFDSFMGGNLMSTAINAHTSLNHLRRLTEAYQAIKKLDPNAPQVVQLHGKRYNIGEVERQLSYLGIDDTNIRGYMSDRTQLFLNDFMKNVEQGRKLTAEEINQNKEAFGHLQRVLNTTTENYQATNQLYRPENAMTPQGRLLYQYSTYSYNQILQNLQMRIRFPMQEWSDKAGTELSTKTNIMKFMYHYNTGNFDELTKMGFSKELIETFPADAYNQIVKYFGIAVGVSTLGHMTIDGVRDLIANPFKDDPKDEWARVNRRKIVNPLAPRSEQFTFGEMIDDFGGDDMMHLMQYLAAVGIDTGLFGRTDILYSTFSRRSITDLTPVSRAVEQAVSDLWQIGEGGPRELSNNMTDVAVRNTFRYFPVVGSSVFSEGRRVWLDRLLKDQGRPTVMGDGGPILPQNIVL